MATDVEKLLVQLSADVRQFEKELAKANGVSNRQFNAIERRARQMNRNLDGILKSTASKLVAPLAGVSAVLGGAELIRLTDTWTDLTSRVNLAAGSMDKGAEVMGRLGEMARRTYSSLEQTTESYLANATALRELGYATDQQLDYTEALNNALVISAAKGQRAESVQNALAKAMADGKLQGDNLNTVIQQGGRVAEALAAGLGVGVNQLRALGAAGKITSRDVFRALTSQMETLRKEAAEMPATISDGVQLLRNALLEYVGNADQATDVSLAISDALVTMADNFDKTADVALQLAAVIAGALVGRSLFGMIRTLGLAGAALVSFTRALAAARTMAGLATALGGVSAAAGPVGLIIGGAVVASLMAYSAASAEATQASRTYEEALASVRKEAANTASVVDNATAILSDKARNQLVAGVGRGVSEVARFSEELRDELHKSIVLFENLSDMNLVTPEQLEQLKSFQREFGEGKKFAADVELALYSLANSNPRFQNIADDVKTITAALGEAIATAKLLEAQLQVGDSSEAGGRGPASRGGAGNTRRALQARQEESRLWEQEQARRAKLGKDQLALESEIARVRKQAADDGIRVTEDQIKRIAQANLAGNAARSSEGKKPEKERADEYERLTARIVDSTTALVAETEVQRGLNPLVEDYGYAVEKVRAQIELLNAAKAAGIEVTPKLRAEIEQLADQYAIATVEAAKLAEEQDKAREAASKWTEAVENLFQMGGDALMSMVSGSEKAADAVKKLALQLALAAAQAALLGTGPLAGLFGALGGGLARGGGVDPWAGMRENGGPVTRGNAYIVGEKRPEVFVPDQNGRIIPRVPSMPDLSGMKAGGGNVFSPSFSIDARGAQPGVGAEIQTAIKQAMDQMRREFPMNTAKALKTIKVMGYK